MAWGWTGVRSTKARRAQPGRIVATVAIVRIRSALTLAISSYSDVRVRREVDESLPDADRLLLGRLAFLGRVLGGEKRRDILDKPLVAIFAEKDLNPARSA